MLVLRSSVRFALRSKISVRSLSTLYAPTHEYIKISGNIGIVGITDHAANALGDIVYVELPQVGKSYSAGDSFGSVVRLITCCTTIMLCNYLHQESVKAASEVYAPVSGEVVEVNSKLEGTPGIVNESPFEDGWFIKIKIAAAGQEDAKKLLDEKKYGDLKASEAH